MIEIEKQIHGTSLKNVWFAEKPIDTSGIINYKEAAFVISNGTEFLTLISDLTENEEDIKAHFSKSCKYKVNRAYREKVEFTILDSESITDDILENYLDFFEEFWNSKQSSIENRKSLMLEMCAYRDKHALELAYATVEGEIAVYHTHIFDNKIARLFHSASLFRLKNNDDESNKNIIGMANRALHYEEMKYFKQEGLAIYDWGGAGKDEEVASITEFKESFGGTPVTYYDGTVENGIKAKTVVALSTIKRKLTGR